MIKIAMRGDPAANARRMDARIAGVCAMIITGAGLAGAALAMGQVATGEGRGASTGEHSLHQPASHPLSQPSSQPVSGAPGEPATGAPSQTPLTPEEIRALVARVIENQHRNDEELASYERVESMVMRGQGKNGADDIKITRVVATGASLERIELEHDGKPVDAAQIEETWRRAAHAIAVENRPGDPHQKASAEKFARRKRERYEMVDAIGKAFRFHWVGRVVKDDRVLVQLTFDPEPSFKSSAIYGLVYPHMRGTAWIDEATGQTYRIEASLTDDVTFAEGLIAKVYRGGQATLEQEEVAPGTWLPAHFTWDYEGRKFLVSSLDGHGRMDARDYRRMGSPAEALAIMRREHPGIGEKP
jgi:hypothetical protein